MLNLNNKIELLLRELPDPEGARLFYERITAEHPRAARAFAHDGGLLSDSLALAAWSPLLATTLTQHPEYLSWLARERTISRVKTDEELGESLARFAMTNTQLAPQVLLARFRRRELLRLYLQDIRRISTLVETTEELSNLADSVLQYALQLAQQELDNLYGSPQQKDARGRTATATFCIVALGKLGSRELNYASDIDLMFLYSHDGETSGKGERGSITNREYFCKLAERISRIVGQPAGEGAAYRVDLRLRPHGRDGALSCSLAEALRYYRETAQAWELQSLIRARAAAGDWTIYANFADGVRQRVYRTDETVARALAHVRLAKQKINHHHRAETGGFNVKLGHGGIREIEFIAQALQLAHGGHDSWLHAPHTLISLGRLADRGLITERERSTLSDAYNFLRTLEHRVQMEHGLQTHTVPEDPERRTLVARRMNFTGPTPLAEFNQTLQEQTAHVRVAYERVFGPAEKISESGIVETKKRISFNIGPEKESAKIAESASTVSPAQTRYSLSTHERARAAQDAPVDAETAAALSAATLFAPRFSLNQSDDQKIEKLSKLLRNTANQTFNARRALTLLARIAASLDKSPEPKEITEEKLIALVHLCAASEYFGEMIESNPSLIPALVTPAAVVTNRDYYKLLSEVIKAEKSFGGELSALRRTWAHLLVEIGAQDAAGAISMRESNRLQATLAAASLDAGYLIAQRETERRYGKLDAEPRLAIFGLGRLGSAGTDYGSDLDIVLVYDSNTRSPIANITHEEAYARLIEILVNSLSSLTRDGYLYRVDMRLRPDGKNGPMAMSAQAFVNYLRERASVWEWLAYVKLRAVAGDMEFGESVEEEARRAIHESAQLIKPEVLQTETRHIRKRLELEKSEKGSAGGIDIKFGAGGMLDAYFSVRYLQLRDNVPDQRGDRSTSAALSRLCAAGSLNDKDYSALNEGYALLRSLDHRIRLMVGRSTRLPRAEDHPTLRDLARAAGYSSVQVLMKELLGRMSAIREAYDRITSQPQS